MTSKAPPTLTLRPLGLERLAPVGMENWLPLSGGPGAFAFCEAVVRAGEQEQGRAILPVADVTLWAERLGGDPLSRQAHALLARMSRPRPAFAGLGLDSPRIMGVLNITPDSFSDGGDRFDPARAVEDGLAMLEAGADILDVGGESTRPGAAPVDALEEARRVTPVVRGLADAGALVSIDTRRARVMGEALAAGARIVNDVTALSHDPQSLPLVARSGAYAILMHMQGEPRTMQANPTYADAPLDIYDYLAERIAACEEAGMPMERLAVDPGIGFGKTVEHNLRVLESMALYQGLGCAVLLGVSRKSFIGRLARGEAPKARLPGSLAAGLAGLARGVHILRVHDVAETKQALSVWKAIGSAGRYAVAR